MTDLLHDDWAGDEETAGSRPSTAPPPAPASGQTSARASGGRKGRGRKKDKQPPPLVYTTLNDFVTDYLAPLLQRKLGGGQIWCPYWWRHPEALSRLSAVWRAWEHLQHEPALGMSQWWLYHCDPHMRALMNPDTGPFAGCSEDRHNPRPGLPLKPADPALFLSPAFSAPRDET